MVEYRNENSYDKLHNLKFSSDDPEWSRNIKRGIASIYQIDLQRFVEPEIHYPIEDEEVFILDICFFAIMILLLFMIEKYIWYLQDYLQ